MSTTMAMLHWSTYCRLIAATLAISTSSFTIRENLAFSLPSASSSSSSSSLSSALSIRGEGYGASNNSTILTPTEAAAIVGVKPAKFGATNTTWKRAWKVHRFMMTNVLHKFDSIQPTDSKLSLACLWWKALAANDSTSPVYDNRLAYDLLPPITRWIVSRRVCRFYPRLHHANVEIRTAYLDKSVSNIINNIDMMQNYNNANNNNNAVTNKAKIRLIVMGGGYDTRCMKLLERLQLSNTNNTNYILECYELDLPDVVHAKQQLIQTRLHIRRPWLQSISPTLIPVNFNNLNVTQMALESILQSDNDTVSATGGGAIITNNIIIFEGVMIYLDEGIPHSLLRICSDVLLNNGNMTRLTIGDGGVSSSSSNYLCFADRLENIPGGDITAAHVEMDSTGWELLDWLPKPGLARHMGVARLRT
jgi:O-methyltransferase involved in polyketide biosynthesis